VYRTSQYPTNLETTRQTPPRTSSLGPAGRWCSIPLHSLLSHVSNRDPACHHLQPGARNDDKTKVSNSMTGLPYTGGISDALSSQVSPQSLSNQAECGVAQTEAEGFSRESGRIWKRKLHCKLAMLTPPHSHQYYISEFNFKQFNDLQCSSF
jgi:hypothetical protein